MPGERVGPQTYGDPKFAELLYVLGGILFATRDGSRPRSRANVVRIGLKPMLRKLGIPTNAGLHAFRHGLATELAEASVPITVLQNQLRHADVKTTLKVYAHVIPQTQRDAMERIGGVQSAESINTVLEFGRHQTTVLHSCDKVERMRCSDKALDNTIRLLMGRTQSMHPG